METRGNTAYPNVAAENAVIFGDVHGQIDAVKELLVSFWAVFEGDTLVSSAWKTFVCVGDWFDKWGDPLRILRFVLGNPSVLSVKWNHERFLASYARWLREMPPGVEKFDHAPFFRDCFLSESVLCREISRKFLAWHDSLPEQLTFSLRMPRWTWRNTSAMPPSGKPETENATTG